MITRYHPPGSEQLFVEYGINMLRLGEIRIPGCHGTDKLSAFRQFSITSDRSP